jgi:superfamily II RNA helicase
VQAIVGQLSKIQAELETLQSKHGVEINVALESELVGIVEQWALGKEWIDLMDETDLDEGDVVRTIRRTIDVLLQITQIRLPTPSNTKEYVNPFLELNRLAHTAILQMKRFPL